MSGFQKRYTDAQRDAVARAQLDRGMTAQQALDALQAGTLAPDGSPTSDPARAVPAPPVAMPKRTAQDLARKLRYDREGRSGGLGEADPQAARAELRRRLVYTADRLTRKLERKARKNDVNPEDLRKAAAAVAAVDALLKPDAPRSSPPPSNGKPAAPSPSTDATPLGALAAEIESEDRSAAAKRRHSLPKP